eukprot:scaffold84966_cov68-Phaeocystis_antarctica.AAC.7
MPLVTPQRYTLHTHHQPQHPMRDAAMREAEGRSNQAPHKPYLFATTLILIFFCRTARRGAVACRRARVMCVPSLGHTTGQCHSNQ